MHYIDPQATFHNENSTGIFASGSDDEGGQSAVVPNLFWKGRYQAYDMGLSIVTPFGLETRYDKDDWRGRYLGVRSDLKTVNINPSIARKVGNWSFGAGVSVQYLDVTLTKQLYPDTVLQALGYPAAQATALGDGTSELKGTSWAWGYNLGVRYQFDQSVFAASFRSTMTQQVKGNAYLYTQTGTQISKTLAAAEITLPATVDLSWSKRYGEQLQVLASATWTGWSSFKELVIKDDTTGSVISYTPENWHDTWRFAMGANYQLNDRWTVRGGLAYDQTPVRDAYRTVRIPDNDRKWLSLGARYNVSPAVALDLAYTHIFTDKTKIDETAYASSGVSLEAAVGSLNGYYTSEVDIVSAQLVWRY